MKKILSLGACLSLVASLAVGGSIAYLLDQEATVNVMTLGNVDITIHEYERDTNADGSYKTDNIDNQQSYVLKPFVSGSKQLVPIVGDPSEPKDSPAYAGWDTTATVRMSQVNSYGGMSVFAGKNAIDKFVTIENTGKSDAFVRTYIAFEVGSADPALIKMNRHEAAWLRTEIGLMNIKDNQYNVFEFVYQGAQLSDKSWRHEKGILPAKDTTYPTLAQVYLKHTAANEDVEKLDGNKDGAFNVLVLTQAVQADGFADATAAFDAAFPKGENNANIAKWFDEEVELPITVDTLEELESTLKAAGSAGAGNTTITLGDDIDMTGKTWTPIKVDGYHGADIVTIEGGGNTITGLTAPLFAGGFAGGSGIVIKNLTIADSEIVSTNTLGSGAFIESVDSMAKITLQNCHLIKSTVTGGSGSRTGGMIGWTAGYNNVNDGPVKTYVTIEDCSVIDSTITSDGSVGGIYGHAGNNAWTYSTVKNCTVKDCKLNSTDKGDWRVGVVVGTANVGEMTIEKITESSNTLTQANATTAQGTNNLYGRFVPGSTGKLVIDGVEIK